MAQHSRTAFNLNYLSVKGHVYFILLVTFHYRVHCVNVVFSVSMIYSFKESEFFTFCIQYEALSRSNVYFPLWQLAPDSSIPLTQYSSFPELMSKSLEWAIISKPAGNKRVLCLCCYKRCVKVTWTFVYFFNCYKNLLSPLKHKHCCSLPIKGWGGFGIWFLEHLILYCQNGLF